MYTINREDPDTVLYDTLDLRKDLLTNQFNISMTNQFKLWVNQILSVNILLFDQKDMVIQNRIQSFGYLPKNTSSDSYGISIKSVYNNYLESIVYFMSSHYDYGQTNSNNYQKQRAVNYQFKFEYLKSRFGTIEFVSLILVLAVKSFP